MATIQSTRRSVWFRHRQSQMFCPASDVTPRWRRPSAVAELRRKSETDPESGMQTRHRPIHSTGSTNAITIAIVSDTHELEREVEVPYADLFIHCGDLTMLSRSLRAIHEFNAWLGELPHRARIVLPGNHDVFLENPANRKLITNATVLINEGIEAVEGLRIWGTPVTPVGPGFCVPSADDRRNAYAKIPNGTDILISHGPPRGILDCSPGSSFHAGDQELLDAVTRVRPRVHAFGHIHGGYGIVGTEHTTFVNAALLGPDGDIERQPVVLRMGRR